MFRMSSNRAGAVVGGLTTNERDFFFEGRLARSRAFLDNVVQ